MRHLGIFGKYWQAGAVKTRLARHLGAESASQLYRAFLKTVLQRFASIGDRRSLVFTPEDRESAFHELSQGRWELACQSDGNLGHRMQTFFRHAFATGAHQVVLIGSDSPSLPITFVQQAFDQLEKHPVVLGPSTDGGFYLIGTTSRLPASLETVAWSTEDVLRNSVERFEEEGRSCFLLPTWYDVDEYAHLIQLSRELSSHEPLPADLSELAAAVHDALSQEPK